MSDFKNRLEIEIEELTSDIKALDDYIDSDYMGHDVGRTQSSLLRVQLKCMETYLEILTSRLSDINERY